MKENELLQRYSDIEDIDSHGKILFVPVVHWPFSSDWERIERKFWEGDLSSGYLIGGSLVARRLKPLKPRALVIDGVVPSLDSEQNRSLGAKARVIRWMPGTPQELCGENDIYVIAGDLSTWNFYPKNAGEDGFADALAALGTSEVADYAQKVVKEEAVTFAACSALIYSLICVCSRSIPRRMDRREFLRFSGGLTAATLLTLLRISSPVAASFSPDMRLSLFLKNIMEVTKYRFSSSDWLEGRTAIAIAKAQDGGGILRITPDESIAVVMGYPHYYEAPDLMKNKKRRELAIRAYRDKMAKAISDLYDVGIVPPEDEAYFKSRDEALKYLDHYFSMMFIYRVDQPLATKFANRADQNHEIDRMVMPVYETTSKQVLEALAA